MSWLKSPTTLRLMSPYKNETRVEYYVGEGTDAGYVLISTSLFLNKPVIVSRSRFAPALTVAGYTMDCVVNSDVNGRAWFKGSKMNCWFTGSRWVACDPSVAVGSDPLEYRVTTEDGTVKTYGDMFYTLGSLPAVNASSSKNAVPHGSLSGRSNEDASCSYPCWASSGGGLIGTYVAVGGASGSKYCGTHAYSVAGYPGRNPPYLLYRGFEKDSSGRLSYTGADGVPGISYYERFGRWVLGPKSQDGLHYASDSPPPTTFEWGRDAGGVEEYLTARKSYDTALKAVDYAEKEYGEASAGYTEKSAALAEATTARDEAVQALHEATQRGEDVSGEDGYLARASDADAKYREASAAAEAAAEAAADRRKGVEDAKANAESLRKDLEAVDMSQETVKEYLDGVDSHPKVTVSYAGQAGSVFKRAVLVGSVAEWQ